MIQTQSPSAASLRESIAASAGSLAGAGEDVAQAVEQPPDDEGADRQEGDQLDHRFEGDGEDEPGVLLGQVDRARAEEDREEREDARRRRATRGPSRAARDGCAARES